MAVANGANMQLELFDGLDKASNTSYSRDVANEVEVRNETLASVTAGSVSDCLHIDGATYEPEHDELRLGKQALAVFELMRDGKWRTLREIVEAIGGGSEAGVSARLRDFRKDKFGKHVVNRRRRGEEALGVFEYQVICK